MELAFQLRCARTLKIRRPFSNFYSSKRISTSAEVRHRAFLAPCLSGFPFSVAENWYKNHF